MILNQLIEVEINRNNAKHYEDLGYKILREHDSRGRKRIICGQHIVVKATDLVKSSKKAIKLKCDYCGDIFERAYVYVNGGHKIISKDACKKCESHKRKESFNHKYGTNNPKIFSEANGSVAGRKNKYVWEDVQKKCQDRNYIMNKLTNTSERCIVRAKVYYICKEHPEDIQETSVESMMSDKKIFLCKKCRDEHLSRTQRESYICDATKICKEKNYQILTKSINNCDDNIDYICNKHLEYGVQHTSLYGLKNYENNCRLCRMPRNEEHWHWQGGISSDRDKLTSSFEYKQWRQSVFERDNYTCQCCNKHGVELHAHHIYNFSDYPELRTKLSNGITLCENCHSINIDGSFHGVYTQFNNTPEQLEEYMKNYKKHQLKVI